MHIDIGAFIAWFVALLPSIKGFTEWLNTSLGVTKAGLDVLKQGQEQLKKEDDKQSLERAKVNAELLRSYTGLGWIEFFVWLTKTMTFFIPMLLGLIQLFKILEWTRERKLKEGK